MGVTTAANYPGAQWNQTDYGLSYPNSIVNKNCIYHPNIDSTDHGWWSGLIRRCCVSRQFDHNPTWCGTRSGHSALFSSYYSLATSARGCNGNIIILGRKYKRLVPDLLIIDL